MLRARLEVTVVYM